LHGPAALGSLASGMGARRAIALMAVVLGLAAGSGGAAEARSHHAAPHASTRVDVWFKRSARLWFTQRTVSPTAAVARAAVNALIAGPNAAESAAGVRSSVPAASRLRGISIASGVATIDLNHAFAAPGPRRRVRMRLAQLTFTATQFPTIRAVTLHIAGHPVASIGSVAVPSQMRRSTFPRLLPAIVVHRPLIGADLAPTVRLTGTSNVFEAAMIAKMVSSGGRVLAKKFFTATCGTGCRGRFAVSLSYHVAHAQTGTVVVSDTSARSGHPPPHIVRIPVHLSP
jgi:Sporulation and spore germination/Immunoglobulin-like domain of bacterial spore germination